MTPTGSDKLELGTHSAAEPQQLAPRSRVVQDMPQRSDTGVRLFPTDFTVPSSMAAGAVWLRYNPQRMRNGGHDSGTQS